jgi:hypothetical protein
LPNLETFQRDFKAAQNRLRPLGRRGWEARRSELLRDLAKLENYPRLSNRPHRGILHRGQHYHRQRSHVRQRDAGLQDHVGAGGGLA